MSKTLALGFFTDTINVINVKVRMKVLLTELYLFIQLSVTLRIFPGHSNVEHTVLTENVVSLSNKVEILYDC